MRTREISRLLTLLDNFNIPCIDGKYFWGNFFIDVKIGRTSVLWGLWGDRGGNGHKLTSSMARASSVFSWFIHETLSIQYPSNLEYKADLWAYPTPWPRPNKIKFDFLSFGRRLEVPDNIHNIVFGFFTGEIPKNILLDAFLHDTDLFDNDNGDARNTTSTSNVRPLIHDDH